MPVKTSGYGVDLQFGTLGDTDYQTLIIETDSPGTECGTAYHNSDELSRNKIKKSDNIEFIVIWNP